MKSNRVVVFDLDGTLIDSAAIVSEILNDIRSELGKKKLTNESFYPWISLGGEDLIKNALDITDDVVTDYLLEFRDRYLNLPTPLNSIYEDVFYCLNSLKSMDIFLAICTNKPRKLVDKVLAETNLIKYFDCINAGGDLPYKKPHPSNLIFCKDYYGVEFKDMIYVGDSLVDQTLANSVGVPFIFYEGGYDDGVKLDLVSGKIKKHSELINLLV